MRVISICYPGIEDICATEIRELCSVDSEMHESAVIFDAPEKRIINYCYFAQTPSKVLGFLGYHQFDSLKNLLDFVHKIDLHGWVTKETSFKVVCTRLGEHDFNSEKVVQGVGGIFFENSGLKVNLKNPDLIIYVYIFNNTCYMGVDLTGLDHGKRDYKTFSPPETINAPIGYALLRVANYDKRDYLMNFNCESGAIAIEAALMATKKSINFYKKDLFRFDRLKPFEKVYYDGYLDELDKNVKDEKLKIFCVDHLMAHIKYTEKNAKIAGVNKLLNFCRMDTEWLDTKFEKASVEKVIALLPSVSNSKSESDIRALYKEIFYQFEYIVKKDALLVFIVRNNEILKEMAKEYKFKVIHERRVFQGQNPYWINSFEKE